MHFVLKIPVYCSRYGVLLDWYFSAFLNYLSCMSTVHGLNVKWNYLSKESQLKSFSSRVLRDGIVRNVNSEFSDKSCCFILTKSSKMFLSNMYKGSVTLLPFSRSEILSSPLMMLFKICFIALYERYKCVNTRGQVSWWNCVSLFKHMWILVMFG